MSVLIKDMGKPKSCYAVIDGEFEYCPFVNTDDDCVLLLKKGTCEGTWEDQYSKCPLIEAPELCEDVVSRQAAIDAVSRGCQEFRGIFAECEKNLNALPSAQPTQPNASNALKTLDCIDRQSAIDALWKALYAYEDETERQFQESDELNVGDWIGHRIFVQNMNDIDRQTILNLPSAQPETEKYEYHYDHTDCIWYRPEARNRCPTTCAQYRDGWNDAMNYIFRDGKGYRPYRRDKQYGE